MNREGMAQAADAPTFVERLNTGCFCVGLDEAALRGALESDIATPGLLDLLQQRCPYVFSARPVFVSHEQMARMSALIAAIESVVALPAYREEVLARSPDIARQDPGGSRGVFFGYDFHVAPDAFGLIEINTNAGGAMLNAVLARAQRACCAPVERLAHALADAERFEHRIAAMFRREWFLAGHSRPLRTIAIVDDAPAEQYLYPEFLLFRRLFERHGLQAVIADPRDLVFRGGKLWHADLEIDLVYNRLTDFTLEADSSSAVRQAYLAHAAVVTPHPQAHALYADKRNLALLTDPTRLEALGVSSDMQRVLLDGIPRTEIVDPANADRLWAGRRRLFFKPFGGFGSRAAYRGDKLTQRVWADIIAGGYVAQALVSPGQRVPIEGEPSSALKFDLRQYVYEGAPQWVAARLYQGQTTNFRTPGGGFAPVYALPGFAFQPVNP